MASHEDRQPVSVESGRVGWEKNWRDEAESRNAAYESADAGREGLERANETSRKSAVAGESTSDAGRAQPHDACGWLQPQRSHAHDLTTSDPHRAGRRGKWIGWIFDRERQTLRHDAERCGPGCRTCGTHWEAESPVCRVDRRSPGDLDRLRCLGNSVTPQQAAFAWRTLR
jgi:hypothetical protein